MSVHAASSGDLPDVFSPVFLSGRRSLLGGSIAMAMLAVSVVIWLAGSANPFTPAGYVGYLTKGAAFGQSRFYGVQRGPTSPGRNSSNHTVVYIPSGPMGVPVTGTFSATEPRGPAAVPVRLQ